MEVRGRKVYQSLIAVNIDMRMKNVNTKSTEIAITMTDCSFKQRVREFKEAEKARKESLSKE